MKRVLCSPCRLRLPELLVYNIICIIISRPKALRIRLAVARGALVGIGLLGVCLPAYEKTASGSPTSPSSTKVNTCNGSFLGRYLAVMVGKTNISGSIGPFLGKAVLCSPVSYKEGNVGPGEHRTRDHRYAPSAATRVSVCLA